MPPRPASLRYNVSPAHCASTQPPWICKYTILSVLSSPSLHLSCMLYVYWTSFLSPCFIHSWICAPGSKILQYVCTSFLFFSSTNFLFSFLPSFFWSSSPIMLHRTPPRRPVGPLNPPPPQTSDLFTYLISHSSYLFFSLGFPLPFSPSSSFPPPPLFLSIPIKELS